MPNTRRRRFSVQNENSRRGSNKMQHTTQNSLPDPNQDIKVITNNLVAMSPVKVKNKIHPSSSKNSSPLEIAAECESKTSMLTIKKRSSVTEDKDVSASSSSIDLLKETKKEPICQSNEEINTDVDESENNNRYTNRDRAVRRDKPRQHRVKVRSPKRRIAIFETKTENDKRTIGTVPIVWPVVYTFPVLLPIDSTEDEDRPSDSPEDMCRICHSGDALSPELGRLISACACRGTVGRVHVKCLERWLTESGKSRCELCGTRYDTKRVHRYGVPRALVMWILSQNAKQLMVDSLGIMLMSPLAVLAAWLSGRTLAGFMTQDSNAAPWPLASTFVLACMTLVCYYCWIVSAATRHALGWWIWYRSQYEVRLQFQESED